MIKNKIFKQNNIAIVYDFDGTLSPLPMQNYTVLPELKLKAKDFWKKVDKEIKVTQAEGMLVYMRQLIEEAHAAKIKFGKKDLEKLGKNILYFPGVSSWFDRINKYVKQKGGNANVYHYIISSGLKEILEGTTIKKYFKQIFASQYYFDHHDVARFPKILITDTNKTQYLFRINKGKEKQSESINTHMDDNLRPIPFSNMIYVGDGLTDVPCMTLVKKNGGFAVAVFEHNNKEKINICAKLLKAGRVDFIAPADYSKNKPLDKRVKLLLDNIISKIQIEKEKFYQ